MAEELFQIAILRLKRAVKLRKDAINYFKTQYGNRGSVIEPESPEILNCDPPNAVSQAKKQAMQERKSVKL